MADEPKMYDFKQYPWPYQFKNLQTLGTPYKYFAKGGCRLAYFLKDLDTSQFLVMKKDIKENPSTSSYWENDLKASKKAESYAQKFNETLKTNKPIKYIIPKFYTFNGDRAPLKNGESILVEPFLGKNYIKFNNNGGYVNNDYQGKSMSAFSHFSYQQSKGEELVCDLQGVRMENEYILTDPVICSKKKEYGNTDIGEKCIQNFFYTHKCNEFCEKWAKHPNPQKPINNNKGTQSV